MNSFLAILRCKSSYWDIIYKCNRRSDFIVKQLWKMSEEEQQSQQQEVEAAKPKEGMGALPIRQYLD